MRVTSLLSAVLTYLFIEEEVKYIKYKNNKKDKNIKSTKNKPITTNKKSLLGILTTFSYRLFLYLCIGTFLLNVLSEQTYNYLSIRIVDNYRIEDFSVTGYQMMGYLHLEDTLIMTLLAGVY